MKNFQYVVRTFTSSNRDLDPDLQSVLNELGATGFRVAGFTTYIRRGGYGDTIHTVIPEREVESD